MDIKRITMGDMTIEVSVNMGKELFMQNSFPDVDGTTFRSAIAFLPVSSLEPILAFAKECEARHHAALADQAPQDSLSTLAREMAQRARDRQVEQGAAQPVYDIGELVDFMAARNADAAGSFNATDFLEALQPENWTEIQGLHTPTIDCQRWLQSHFATW